MTGLLGALLPGAANLSPEDRRALLTQGLLAMGAGILKNNTGNYGKAGPAIGAGISEGLLAMNKGAEGLAEQRYRQQVMERGYGDPAGVREFEAMTQGLSEEEKLQARKVRLGIEGRASSAGFQPIKFKGPDMRERVGVFNPRTGRIDTPDGLSFEPGSVMPLGLAQDYQVDPSLPPEVQRAIHESEASGQPLPPHVDLAPAVPRPSTTAGTNPFVGPAPGEVAYAEEAARRAALLNTLPAELNARTDAAIDQAGGVAAAQTAVKVGAEADKRVRNAERDIAKIEEAIRILPNASGGLVQSGRDRVVGVFGASTEGAQATAQLKLISADLVGNVPRFEGPQSNIDVQFYKDAAGDLANDLLPVQTRLAAARKMLELRKRAADAKPTQPKAADPLGILD